MRDFARSEAVLSRLHRILDAVLTRLHCILDARLRSVHDETRSVHLLSNGEMQICDTNHSFLGVPRQVRYPLFVAFIAAAAAAAAAAATAAAVTTASAVTAAAHCQ